MRNFRDEAALPVPSNLTLPDRRARNRSSSSRPPSGLLQSKVIKPSDFRTPYAEVPNTSRRIGSAESVVVLSAASASRQW